MEAIKELTRIDFFSLLISVFVILTGLKAIVSLFEWIIEKLGLETKWIRKKRDDHELLIKTAQNLSALQEKHNNDVEQSILHDKRIQNDLSEFMNEMMHSISETKNEIKKFAQNRIHDREQSYQIQQELTYSIKNIADANQKKDKQINSLMIAQREVLADKINRKYKYYIAINGIPEDEVDEFTNLHMAYKGCGGNHSGDAKYEYVMKHLPVIPVEVKLVTEKKDEIQGI